MPGAPKFGILEYNNEELFGPAEYIPDVTDLLPMSESMAPTYVNDLLTKVVWYRSATQTEANRVAQADITYSGDYPSSAVYKLYNTTDGTVLLKTITLTYTWSGDKIVSVSRSIT